LHRYFIPEDVIVQHHIFLQVVSPFKDVEGLHFKFHYNLYHKCVTRLSVTLFGLTPLSIRFIEPKSLLGSITSPIPPTEFENEEPPAGTVKSIIPCTPLAIVKALEFTGVYNKILPYGDRAYGKTITVINR
jgi:methylenetetrahydrofolate dehydrogenase (NAD+)